MNAAEIQQILPYLTPAERAEVNRILSLLPTQVWYPLPGPQTMAYTSTATIIGYGGAAGGGKTDLACGKSLTQHQKVLVLRREATQLTGIVDRFTELLGGRDGYNGAERIWRLTGRQIEFGSTPNPDDWNKYQGRPHDLLVFDEAANFLESQVRALLGWLRSVDPNQRCQALLTFNPPTNAEGRWIVDFFAPWLDPKHPNPAKPGELRWFATIDGKDVEVADGTPFQHGGDTITPLSRTFIPSRVSDNPYLMGTGYMATLQSLPEPLRSQMLHGDFQAGMEDDAMQVIPTAWIEAAQARWKQRSPKPRMDSLGVDVARGGRDNTILARRHGNWYDEPLVYEGKATPDGPAVAGVVIAALRDAAPIHIDVIGVGASPYDFLRHANQQIIGVNVAEQATARDKSGKLGFANIRSQLWWGMREDLDPANDTGIALPPDRQLLVDLAAPVWRLQSSTIYVESREDIIKRIGRSPDWASAYLLARMDTPRRSDLVRPGALTAARREYDPLQSRD
ncbi:terminase [Bordetella genomosp. 9]|uniref:Terminase n=1 Tax=Bordetella genomosp. 9 TaxID=1416803 RepID=A0A261RGI6_9BORD|nr:terminase [Bordetella genomosp. 9]OZI23740.1 terminase [Bordetella genomosp. 9]